MSERVTIPTIFLDSGGRKSLFSRSSTDYLTQETQLLSLGGDLSSTDIFFFRFDAPLRGICTVGIRGICLKGLGGLLILDNCTRNSCWPVTRRVNGIPGGESGEWTSLDRVLLAHITEPTPRGVRILPMPMDPREFWILRYSRIPETEDNNREKAGRKAGILNGEEGWLEKEGSRLGKKAYLDKDRRGRRLT